MAAARGLTNVRFFPYQPKALLHESFATADAFLVSLKPGLEGYIVPSKVYGILAAGPAVRRGGRSELRSRRRSRASTTAASSPPPGDPDALADGDRDAVRRSRRRARDGRAARGARRWQFDRRVAVQAYHDLFAARRRAARRRMIKRASTASLAGAGLLVSAPLWLLIRARDQARGRRPGVLPAGARRPGRPRVRAR